MLFTSVQFACFFAIVLTGLAVLRKQNHKIRWLLAAGVVFYGAWNWRFLALIGFTSVFDFCLGIQIGKATGALKKRLLVLDICVNLLLLCVFKYLDFFISTADVLFGVHFSLARIMLPIGISFFVFEAMSYCIDIYRGKLVPYSRWDHFALFIFFFPRMVAGPIIRGSDFLPQLRSPIRITAHNLNVGGQMFLLGLTKKLVIADRLSDFVDLVYANPALYSSASVWQATIAYSIQIYCDFSGYSDMAIGLAKIMGFELPANFRLPYIALNLTDFWRRWHISLSSWLRDYLYIPLGGNRKGVTRTYLNLLITMTLGGLWHGASWHFVLWGVLQGLGLAVHKAYRSILGPRLPEKSGWPLKVVSWTVTYTFVCFCWVFFRAQSFPDAVTCVVKMVGGLAGGLTWLCGPLAAIAPLVVLSHLLAGRMQHQKDGLVLAPAYFSHLVLLFAWVLGVYFMSATRTAPFIYFQF